MTILQALDGYYPRLEGVAEQGWSPEKFGWCILLNPDGSVAGVQDLRETDGKKPKPRLFMVPASYKRPGTVPRSFFL